MGFFARCRLNLCRAEVADEQFRVGTVHRAVGARAGLISEAPSEEGARSLDEVSTVTAYQLAKHDCRLSHRDCGQHRPADDDEGVADLIA